MDKRCAIEGCNFDSKRFINGLCTVHYQRQYHGRDMEKPIEQHFKNRTCSVPGCELKHRANGLCGNHYAMWYDANRAAKRICSVDGCERIAKLRRTQCERHIYRAMVGIPLDALEPRGNIHFPIGNGGAHDRVKSLWGAARQYPCMECQKPAQDWAYDDTDPSYLMITDGELRGLRYSRYPEFYMPMCKKCHMKRDGKRRAEELFEYRMTKYMFRDDA